LKIDGIDVDWHRFSELMSKVNVLSRFGIVILTFDNKMIVYSRNDEELNFYSIGEFEDFIIEKYDELIIEVEGKS
jgi:hypothetical protein